ncbi:hypothetical protein [Burkholderia stagnalis]|uniref:hypothetical protein n=1 Tax=Burkholderia stagnalis TaxID=1503054 RepID=UPI0012D93257|nr:hypothetical protein [Burkholderia stagnalis]
MDSPNAAPKIDSGIKVEHTGYFRSMAIAVFTPTVCGDTRKQATLEIRMVHENPVSSAISLVSTRDEIAYAMHHYEKSFYRNLITTQKTAIFRPYL